jgi:hypothetical protein
LFDILNPLILRSFNSNDLELMEFSELQQIDPEDLSSLKFDVFIAVSGYERRCSYLLENYKIKADKRIAIGFTEKSGELFRKRNNEILKAHGFQFITASGNDSQQLNSSLISLLYDLKRKKLKILIDYSCMTKMWYSSIINFLLSEEHNIKKAQAYFSYTPAKFDKPKKQKSIKYAHSVILGKRCFDPDKPTALIIGLGVEKNRATYLQQMVKPEHTILMYADPAPDRNYVECVFDNNQEIIATVGARNLINYPLEDQQKTNEMITNICLDLRMKYNVILAPLGPKVHALSCLLLSSRYPDIDVWRVSAGSNESIYDKTPDGPPLILKVLFSDDED